jgi:Tfp pilus assembly pilus retraction ATPase PilT
LRSLQGKISSVILSQVEDLALLRFKNLSDFETPEALILYEQGILSNEEILDAIELEVGRRYITPKLEYVPKEIVDFYATSCAIPISYDNLEDTIKVGILYENKDMVIKPYRNKNIDRVYVPIHWYVEQHTYLYSVPSFLYEIPIKDVFDYIVSEAVSLQAADITISARALKSIVYFNVRKRNVYSKRAVSKDMVDELAKFVSVKAKQPIIDTVSEPRYFSLDLDAHHRGRAVVVSTYHGKSTTIRVLPNKLFSEPMESLNLTKNTCDFIRKYVMNNEYGLRLLVGPTFSGKNTTISACLYEMLMDGRRKGISVEQPVEILMDFLEQMNSETKESFAKNIESLLRQNPDVVYITEITDSTAEETLNVANTGKIVFSALHANSIADVPARLRDITGLSFDRIILNLHSVVFQELRRDDELDRIYPVNRCLYFTQELKDKLFGASLSEIITTLREEEEIWSS